MPSVQTLNMLLLLFTKGGQGVSYREAVSERGLMFAIFFIANGSGIGNDKQVDDEGNKNNMRQEESKMEEDTQTRDTNGQMVLLSPRERKDGRPRFSGREELTNQEDDRFPPHFEEETKTNTKHSLEQKQTTNCRWSLLNSCALNSSTKMTLFLHGFCHSISLLRQLMFSLPNNHVLPRVAIKKHP